MTSTPRSNNYTTSVKGMIELPMAFCIYRFDFGGKQKVARFDRLFHGLSVSDLELDVTSTDSSYSAVFIPG